MQLQIMSRLLCGAMGTERFLATDCVSFSDAYK